MHCEYRNPGWVPDQAGAVALLDGGLGVHSGAGKLRLDQDVDSKAMQVELMYFVSWYIDIKQV